MKCKIFSGVPGLEGVINEWLSSVSINIIKMVQSECGSGNRYSFTLTIIYEEKE